MAQLPDNDHQPAINVTDSGSAYPQYLLSPPPNSAFSSNPSRSSSSTRQNRNNQQAQPAAPARIRSPVRQDPSIPQLWRQGPPARSRRPYKLHNKDCGARYDSCGLIAKRDHKLLSEIWGSQQCLVTSLLAVSYYFRCNVIHKKGAMPKEDVRAIFETTICRWPFSLHELLKRYCMRTRQLGDRNLDDLNFWKVGKDEMDAFTKWLKDIGSFDAGGKAFELWRFGTDPKGKPILKVNANEINLNYFQLFNTIHDSLYQWRSALYGERWINHCKFATGYRMS